MKLDLRKLKWDSCGENVRFFYGDKVVRVPEEHIESVKQSAIREYSHKVMLALNGELQRGKE